MLSCSLWVGGMIVEVISEFRSIATYSRSPPVRALHSSRFAWLDMVRMVRRLSGTIVGKGGCGMVMWDRLDNGVESTKGKSLLNFCGMKEEHAIKLQP